MNKTILITGSTDGIGKLAANKLAKEGHEIYLHGRNRKKLEAVIEEMKASSKNQKIKGFVADFADLKEVKQMAAEVSNETSKLDVLINNAGVYKSNVSITKDGLDIRFAVNYFAPFLLTQKLLSTIKQGHQSRIINLSSAAQAPVSLPALTGKRNITTQEAYAQSKLALTMWSMYLAETEPELNIIPVNPGSLLNTNMVNETFGFHRSSADKGGDILYNLATLEKFQATTGKYFDNDIGTFGSIHPAGKDKADIKSLIDKTVEFLTKFD